MPQLPLMTMPPPTKVPAAPHRTVQAEANRTQIPMQVSESTRRVRRVLRNMLSVWPFFGQLALRLPLVVDGSRKTIASDGTALYFNPKWIAETCDEQIRENIAGLVIACGLKHHTRRRGRDYSKWQWASQQVRKPFLVQAGLTENKFDKGLDMNIERAYLEAPDANDEEDPDNQNPDKTGNSGFGAAMAGNPPESSDEAGEGEVMDFVPDKPDSDGGQGGQGGQGEAGSGGTPAPSAGDKTPAQQVKEQEQEWDKALEQAKHIDQQTKDRGTIPGNLKQTIESMHAHTIDWQALLRRFMDSRTKADYSWSRPNRRHIHAGIYLPSQWSESMDEIVFAVDTSGSMDDEELAAVWSEIRGAANEVNPGSVTVMQCDSVLQSTDTYRIGELPDTIEVKGRGGTDFVPVFKHLDEERSVAPACMIYMTDLEGQFPAEAPSYPVLWIATGRRMEVPFGEVIKLELAD